MLSADCYLQAIAIPVIQACSCMQSFQVHEPFTQAGSGGAAQYLLAFMTVAAHQWVAAPPPSKGLPARAYQPALLVAYFQWQSAPIAEWQGVDGAACACLRQDMARLGRWMAGKAVGLVLSGGGSRGLAHLGVLHALDDAGIPVDVIGGTSQVCPSISCCISRTATLHLLSFTLTSETYIQSDVLWRLPSGSACDWCLSCILL